MRNLTPFRVFTSLLTVFLSIFPAYVGISNNFKLFILWIAGIFLLGCLTTFRTRSLQMALKPGIVIGVSSGILFDGLQICLAIVRPLQEWLAAPPTTPEGAGAYGWLPLVYVFLILGCMVAIMATTFFSLASSVLGGLIGLLVSRMKNARSRRAVKW